MHCSVIDEAGGPAVWILVIAIVAVVRVIRILRGWEIGCRNGNGKFRESAAEMGLRGDRSGVGSES